ncbi:hypothetical protein [Actinomadura atramentaria]|uniref:hypothetical protein n=1 Tax=Actinomadura atramentaria TaxID=1990 RepID=UPI0003615623|nr:hypothetical protein [Actinomadura atramentaria]
MAKRPKKNRSSRDKQLARERARRQARKFTNPLFDQPPPFGPYKEWIRVPSAANDLIEYPGKHDERLDDGAKEMADTLIHLGPRYKGQVPIAALYLEEQIKRGEVFIAITGRPDECREIPLVDLARDVSDPEFLQKLREEYPEADLPEQAQLVTDDAAAFILHSVHALGYLVMDDDHVLNLAIPPTAPGGEWILNGHVEK